MKPVFRSLADHARKLGGAMIALLFLSGPVTAGPIADILAPGELVQGHARFEGECVKCHKKFDKGAQSGLCLECHKEVGKDVAGKTGFHGRIQEKKECRECHTDHKGRKAHIVQFDAERFDHAQTDFQLKGGHRNAKVTCKSCHHPQMKFREAPMACNGCHKKDDKHKGSLGHDCAQCHAEQDWKTTSFDHDKTRYKLLGKHVEVKCVSCHFNNIYKETPAQCASCHRKDDGKAHKGSFGTKCETCHSEKGWKEILFDHDRQTRYPLLGKHRDTKCTSCHQGDLYRDKLQTACVSCHRKEDDKAHKGGFGAKCETCHVERGWKEVLFDHDKQTRYPLLGKHRDTKCSSCHQGDLYRDKLQTSCASCHSKDDDKAHKGGFGAKCETCHVERGWKEVLFDHDKQTRYPLLGKHRATKCTSCHKGNLYKDKLQTVCYACHQQDDKHKGQEGRKCETCHKEDDWHKSSFDHRLSRFPLTGKHVQTECRKCHSTPAYKDAAEDCWSCHEKQDTHKRRFGTLCENCHNARDWKVWDFDHDKTGFRLDGGHRSVACYDCHLKAVDKKVSLSAGCSSCHDKDDVHDESFGRQCERCHEVTSWKNFRAGGLLINSR